MYTSVSLQYLCVCVYRRQVLKLDQFHLRCLLKIAGIKWQDRTTNVEVLQTCKIAGMEALLLQAQFRWAGHLVRMPDNRIPKQIFYRGPPTFHLG